VTGSTRTEVEALIREGIPFPIPDPTSVEVQAIAIY
jgi:hypothetical protein